MVAQQSAISTGFLALPHLQPNHDFGVFTSARLRESAHNFLIIPSRFGMRRAELQ